MSGSDGKYGVKRGLNGGYAVSFENGDVIDGMKSESHESNNPAEGKKSSTLPTTGPNGEKIRWGKREGVFVIPLKEKTNVEEKTSSTLPTIGSNGEKIRWRKRKDLYVIPLGGEINISTPTNPSWVEKHDNKKKSKFFRLQNDKGKQQARPARAEL